MPYLESLRAPIGGFPPISQEEAEELAERARNAVAGKYKERFEPRPGEDPAMLQALGGILEFADFRISAMARQTLNATSKFYYERDVIQPAEEAFALKHGLSASDLEDAWGQRRAGIRGIFFREEIERKAGLRDDFFALIDAIGVEEMGERYEYNEFIAGLNPEDFLTAFYSRLDRVEPALKLT